MRSFAMAHHKGNQSPTYPERCFEYFYHPLHPFLCLARDAKVFPLLQIQTSILVRRRTKYQINRVLGEGFYHLQTISGVEDAFFDPPYFGCHLLSLSIHSFLSAHDNLLSTTSTSAFIGVIIQSHALGSSSTMICFVILM